MAMLQRSNIHVPFNSFSGCYLRAEKKTNLNPIIRIAGADSIFFVSSSLVVSVIKKMKMNTINRTDLKHPKQHWIMTDKKQRRENETEREGWQRDAERITLQIFNKIDETPKIR